ncbi:hypothetical protein FIBSPDRAFT_867689, partial [Athelia psychrophila]
MAVHCLQISSNYNFPDRADRTFIGRGACSIALHSALFCFVLRWGIDSIPVSVG